MAANNKKPETVNESVNEVVNENIEAVNEVVNEKPKKVKIKLPLTRNEKNDVYVAVNGKSYLIKRGEYVEVPACVAEVLENREKMLNEALEFEAKVAQG